MNDDSQQGFSLVEMIVVIVTLAMFATAFISAFSSVLRTSASPLQLAIMENIAASQMDKLLSGTYQSALAVPTSATVNIDGMSYYATFRSAAITGVPTASAVHVTVTVSCDTCASGPTLSGDVYDIR